MREILFRGKRIDNGEWAKSQYPLGTMFAGCVQNDFDPSTVGQYTGLTDKNGVKIFEGDIVKMPDETYNGDIQIKGNVYEVCFGNGVFYLHRTGVNAFCNQCVKVIGNIHDNPELLEG